MAVLEQFYELVRLLLQFADLSLKLLYQILSFEESGFSFADTIWQKSYMSTKTPSCS